MVDMKCRSLYIGIGIAAVANVLLVLCGIAHYFWCSLPATYGSYGNNTGHE